MYINSKTHGTPSTHLRKHKVIGLPSFPCSSLLFVNQHSLILLKFRTPKCSFHQLPAQWHISFFCIIYYQSDDTSRFLLIFKANILTALCYISPLLTSSHSDKFLKDCWSFNASHTTGKCDIRTHGLGRCGTMSILLSFEWQTFTCISTG